jgi:uncharacterized membrane protein YhaH (DUF805 family)
MDRRRARNWYWWLWLSPLLTMPTLGVLYGLGSGLSWTLLGSSRPGSGSVAGILIERAAILVAVLGSALWHLVLLVPARDKEYAFVRWHGGQALLQAGVRTAVPAVLGLLIGGYGPLLAIPILLVVWFGGTLWGQLQAKDGKCSVMERSGQEVLPARTGLAKDMQVRKRETQALIETVRFSRDPEERRRAIAELDRRGMVEAL